MPPKTEAELLAELVRAEQGSHIALRLAPGASLDRVHEILVARRWPRVARPRTNADIGVSLVYVDGATDDGRARRIEFVARD